MSRSVLWCLGSSALLGALVLGCGQPPKLVVRESSLETDNGVSLNGASLNGVSLNGVSLNGVSLNGVSLNGVSLNGVSLNGVSLNGSQLNGVSLNGVSLNGVALIGATLNGMLSNGASLPMRIDGIRQGTGADSDVWFYSVRFQSDKGWVPLCPGDKEAIALKGRWDYSAGTSTGGSRIDDPGAITFACENKALAKCVLFGYKPWYGPDGVCLCHYHQACTRMLRADYCGDGSSYTLDGTTINLYDRMGLQTDTRNWTLEAEWKESGAQCVKDTTKLRLQLLGASVPSCVTNRVKSWCGAFGLSDGSLLITEYVQSL